MAGERESRRDQATIFTGSLLGITNPRETDTAVTALWCSAVLFEVVVDKLSTWGFYNTPPVGGGVVRSSLTDRNALGHW